MGRAGIVLPVLKTLILPVCQNSKIGMGCRPGVSADCSLLLLSLCQSESFQPDPCWHSMVQTAPQNPFYQCCEVFCPHTGENAVRNSPQGPR
eukprot:3096786-Rhodomonas_salina.2